MNAFIVVVETADYGEQSIIGPFADTATAEAWMAEFDDELWIRPRSMDGGYRHTMIASADTALSPSEYAGELQEESW